MSRTSGSTSDKVWRADILEHAYRLCRANGGAAGVDRETFEGIESREDGLEGWLGILATELREESYRPLGIPTIRDRVVQQAARLVVEPIFEADFEPNAYGYRPKRGTLDAVSLEREQLLVRKTDLEIQAERLLEELDKARSRWLGGPVVTQVSLNLEGLDELTRVRVRAEISGILDDLVGRPVSELDPALAFHLLDERDFVIEGQRIGMAVKAVVLGPETEFWVELKALTAKGTPTGG